MNNPLFFGGTAYLGMSANTEFLELVYAGLRNYGINFGASRNNNLCLELYQTAEMEIGRRFLSQDAIVMSSGYLSAQLIIQHYFNTHVLLYAPESHPALWIGEPAKVESSFCQWTEYALDFIDKASKPVLVVSNSLNNIVPEFYQFEWLSRRNPDREVLLLVDDSHGVGITGENGAGVYSELAKLKDLDVVVVASMAKALGIDAGMVLGSSKIISRLRKSALYAGASPPSPGMLYAWMNAESIYVQNLLKLRENCNYFENRISAANSVKFHPGFPVYLLNDADAERRLGKKGINISSFAYPDQSGPVLNRVVLSSLHDIAALERLAEAII